MSPRVALFERLRAGGAEWGAFAERMRFRIGSDPASRRIPFAIGTDVSRPAAAAVADLFSLLQLRAEGTMSGAYGRLAHVEVRDRHFGLRSFRDGSMERRLGRILVGSDPLIDAGLLESWLLRGGGGALLLARLRTVYLKSLEEELRQGAGDGGGDGQDAGRDPGPGLREPAAWATHLALQRHLLGQKEILKSWNVRGLGYESLERTVGIALGALQAVAADDAMQEIRARGIPSVLASTDWIAFGRSPIALVGIRQSALRHAPNPYGIPREFGDLLDAAMRDPLNADVASDAPSRIAAVVRVVTGRADLHALALDVGAVQELRAAVLGYLREFDVGREPRNEALAASVLEAPTISAALRNTRAFEAGAAAARALAAGADGARGQRLAALAEHFDRVAHRGATIAPEDQLVRGVAQSWLIWRIDRWLEDTLDEARGHLVDRAQEFGIAELKREYEAGKIYRIAPDEQPLLREQKQRQDAHLFVDLKGFTRMVATTKELSTAEFLKHEFYQPILRSALSFRAAGRRLELNNLLGDAVSFSGDVVAMIHLAEEVRLLFAEQARRLGSTGASGRVEAGLFISYGAAAENITIDSAGWGDAGVTEWVDGGGGGKAQRVKVAISEKINESARGTARSGAVWARMQALLASRQAGGDAASGAGVGPELPWQVYVEDLLQVTLPDALIAACEQAMDSGDANLAARTAAQVAEVLRVELGSVKGEAGGSRLFTRNADIYNVGRAISKEAVDAFLLETAAQRVHRHVDLPVASLPPAFRRFVFPEETIRLIASWDTGFSRPLPFVFRFAGELSFRGFEGIRRTAIYELLDPEAPLFALLEQHYFAAWRP